jgi:predicted pore-forming effector associated with SMODS systems
VTAERQRLSHAVTAGLRSAQPGAISGSDRLRLRETARDIQYGILRTRLHVSRVPEWVYRRYRSRDELDFADTAEGHRQRLST